MIASFAIIMFSLIMLFVAVETPHPSYINCFTYLHPLEGNLIYTAAIALGIAQIYTGFHKRRAVIPFTEALIILSLLYLALVGFRAFDFAISGPALLQSLATKGVGLAAILGLAVWVLNTDKDDELF
ncbi:hypothetical protein [Pseudaestuariivita rosea]|uniref:hypothetical protein n=1 Tax=Pseudaestuariivita rosea TaxID=2763263 RepID=UPI001ABBB625|nr:hypothetical protein [Pseudaestuariivita rosea]